MNKPTLRELHKDFVSISISKTELLLLVAMYSLALDHPGAFTDASEEEQDSLGAVLDMIRESVDTETDVFEDEEQKKMLLQLASKISLIALNSVCLKN